MRKIPKSFQIMGHTIKVAVVSERDWATLGETYAIEGAVGLYSDEVQAIFIKKGPRSQMLHTLYHEIMHAVLFYMGHKLWADEKFVDQLGGLMAQVEASAH